MPMVAASLPSCTGRRIGRPEVVLCVARPAEHQGGDYPLAGPPLDGLDSITPTFRGLLCHTQKGFAFVVDCTQAKEFTLAHWLVNGADGGRLFVRCFGGGGAVRENPRCPGVPHPHGPQRAA